MTPVPAPSTKFAFITHKPKALKVAEHFATGARSLGFSCTILGKRDAVPPGHVAVFYGVVPETWDQFNLARRRGRAVVFDNGWFAATQPGTLRWAWNGFQADPAHLLPREDRLARFNVPTRNTRLLKRNEDRALLCLQSDAYFQNARTPFTADEWKKDMVRRLSNLGYKVTVRPKPTKARPAPAGLIDMAKLHGIVVSFNSSACFTTAMAGIPSFCDRPSTVSPLCPREIPRPGEAERPTEEARHEMAMILAHAETTYEDLSNGSTLNEILMIPEHHRKGLTYAPQRHRR